MSEREPLGLREAAEAVVRESSFKTDGTPGAYPSSEAIIDLRAALAARESAGSGLDVDKWRLRDAANSHRWIRRKGFPVHRENDECYCDTCWSYLVEEAGADPEHVLTLATTGEETPNA